MPGEDFVLVPGKLSHDDILVLPRRDTPSQQCEMLRHSWVLVRRKQPCVPCPENTPLPNSKMTAEQRSKIFSVYLRAWTMAPSDATAEVPLLCDLNLTAEEWASK